jgi:hypothetical protein
MRARNVKPGLFKNEILGAADPLLTLLFEGLWCMADREGRLEDRPLRIKAEIFPYREIPDIHGYLTQLEEMGFIHRYKVNDAALIEVVTFKKHQSPHHTEKKSQLPAPVNSPLEHRENPPDSLIPDSLIHGFSDSQIQSENTKASTSLTFSQKKEIPPTKNGRPVLTGPEFEWLRQTAKRLGLPTTTSERDHAIGAQYVEACGCSMDPIFAVLDERAARGTESFKTIGDIMAAAISHDRYLDQRNGGRQ